MCLLSSLVSSISHWHHICQKIIILHQRDAGPSSTDKFMRCFVKMTFVEAICTDLLLTFKKVILVELLGAWSMFAYLRIRLFGLALSLFASGFHTYEIWLYAPMDGFYLLILRRIAERHIVEPSIPITFSLFCCGRTLRILHWLFLIVVRAVQLSFLNTSLFQELKRFKPARSI